MKTATPHPPEGKKRAYRHRSALEALEGRTLLSTYLVTNAGDSGAGTLRQAILDANARSGADLIAFAIGTGAKTISPTKALPAISDATTIDATTQPGYVGNPLITLKGSGAGSSSDGLKITGSGVIVRGLVINRFGGSGILVLGGGGNRIAGNYIGTDSTGFAAAANGGLGVLLQSPNNVVGGTTPADRNVISGNTGSGISIYTAAATNNTVIGNFIGTAASGTAKLANGKNGVQIDGGVFNTIGGLTVSARNIISGNARDGVLIVNRGSTLNAVQGNFIGTDLTGTKKLGNGWYGAEISQPNNVVGGGAMGAGNIISGNGKGGLVLFLATASGNRVQGNYIGTDVTGRFDIGNTGRGVEFTNGASDNRVGGTKLAERNVISGNDNGGVGFYSGSKMNLLQGNFIGTTAGGNAALGNSGVGVIVTAGAGTNFIGGVGAGNVISANNQGIVLSSGTSPTIVQGNKIGTDNGGWFDLGNATDGIYVGSSQNQIGGKKRGTGNIISGNNGDGLRINNSSGNLVRRNVIGANAAGTAPVANGKNGVLMMNTNDTPIRGNTIAFNAGNGVQVATGSGNAVVSNSIYSNGGLGINLGWDGASGNDASDNDGGANGLQNFPLLTSAQNDSSLSITGTITGKANSVLYVELFCVDGISSNGYGQGATFLGAVTVTTNASGQATFALDAETVPADCYITATATATDGSTSEFSKGMKAK
jgi:hypothetical protein